MMSAEVNMGQDAGVSPRLKARIAGAIYLISGEAFTFAQNSVRAKLIVSGDAAATAHNILTHQALYRQGIAAELVPLFFIVTMILYDLLRPVNKSLAQLAMVFSLTGCIFGTLVCLLHIAPLAMLADPHLIAAFPPAQLQSLALFSLNIGNQITSIFMIFFGSYNVLMGYLIFRSTFLPRIIGALLSIAGLSYLFYFFAAVLSPVFAASLSPNVYFWPGAAGEGSLILWLLIVGVNEQKWRQKDRTWRMSPA